MLHNVRLAKPYGLANRKSCHIQMLLNIEKPTEQNQERSSEWLVNTYPDEEDPLILYQMTKF